MHGYSDLGFARVDVDRAGRTGDPEVFGGVAALLTMLNSCAPGVVVANIDNGFGAGVFAARVARRAGRASQ